MNNGAYAIIPFVVIAEVAFLFTIQLTLRVLIESRGRELLYYAGGFLLYGGLGYWAFLNENTGAILATFVTLFVAILSRTYALHGAISRYNNIKLQKNIAHQEPKKLLARLIEILPDITLILLLFVMAKDTKAKFNLGNIMMYAFYTSEVIYAMVVLAYITTCDRTEKIINNINRKIP